MCADYNEWRFIYGCDCYDAETRAKFGRSLNNLAPC